VPVDAIALRDGCYLGRTPCEEYLIVETVGVKALKTNPSALSKAFDDKRRVLITRRGEPIGIAAPFDDQLIDLGFLPRCKTST
jgi:hypothetical protein